MRGFFIVKEQEEHANPDLSLQNQNDNLLNKVVVIENTNPLWLKTGYRYKTRELPESKNQNNHVNDTKSKNIRLLFRKPHLYFVQKHKNLHLPDKNNNRKNLHATHDDVADVLIKQNEGFRHGDDEAQQHLPTKIH